MRVQLVDISSAVWSMGCRVCFDFLLNLTQPWNIINAARVSTVAFTAYIYLRPRPLRACAKPQVGVSPSLGDPLVIIVVCALHMKPFSFYRSTSSVSVLIFFISIVFAFRQCIVHDGACS